MTLDERLSKAESWAKSQDKIKKPLDKTAGAKVPASSKALKTGKQSAKEDFWSYKAASATEQALAAADAMSGGVSETQKKSAAAQTALASKKYKKTAAKTLPKGTEKTANIHALGAGDYTNTRIDRALNAALYGTVSSLGEINRQLLAPTGNLSIGQSAQAAVKGIPQAQLEKEKAAAQKTKQLKAQKFADYMAQRSSEEQEKAKAGLGKGGQLLIDTTVAGAQMLGDAGMNILLPGSGLASMATRVYGQSAGEARRAGKNEFQQVLSGAKSAAIETATERMFDGLAGIYGKGKADEFVNAFIRKASSSDAGRTALRVLSNFGGEAAEEIASDILNPIADRVLGLSTGPMFTKEDIPQMLYDGLIGGILGGVGGGVNIATGENARQNARLRIYEEAVKAAESSFAHNGKLTTGMSESGVSRAAGNFSDTMNAQNARRASFRLMTGNQGLTMPDTEGGLMTAQQLVEWNKSRAAKTTVEDGYLAEKARMLEKGNENAATEDYYTKSNQDQANTFSKEIDSWDGKSPKTFSLNMSSEPLKSIGVQADKLVIRSDKIGKILKKHPGMSISVIKQAPSIINNPIITLKSKSVNSRVVMFGEVNDENGVPVLVALELTPSKNGGDLNNISTVSSLYGKDKDITGFIRRSDILYLDTNKNRTDTWLHGLGLQSPSDTTKYGSIGNISYADGSVNIKGIPFEELIKNGTPQKSFDGRPDHSGIDTVTSDEVSDNSISESTPKSNMGKTAKTVAETSEGVIEAQENGTKEKIPPRDEILKKNKATFYEKAAELFPTVKSRTLADAVDRIAFELQQKPNADINTIYDTFQKLWQESTMTVKADPVYKEAAAALKGRRVFVNDSIRADIGDDWRSISTRARVNGLYFTKDINDRGVDVLTQEMAASYPGLFDESSTDGSKMVYDLIDVLARSRDSKIDLPGGIESDYGKNASRMAMNDTYGKLMRAADELLAQTKADLSARHEEAQARRAEQTPERQLEKARSAAVIEPPKNTTALDKVTGKYPIISDVSYSGAEGLAAREKAAYKTKKLVEKMEKDLNPTIQEKAFAKDMAKGIYTEMDIPLTLNSKKITALADYYAAEGSYKENLIAQKARDNKAAREAVAEKLVANSTGYTPPKALFLNFNTMKRNIEKSFGSEAPEIIKWTIDPIRENSKNKKLWQMDKRAGLDAFQLTREESALVQQVIEGRAAQEEMSKLSPNEVKDIESVIHNMNNGQSRAAANADFNLTQPQLDLAEKYRKWLNTQASLKNADADKVTRAAEWLTKQYGEIYDAINDFLVSHGYKPIGFIKGYAPHLQPEKQMSGFANALQRLGLETEVVELPTEIAGRTETFKPGKSWDPNFLSRGKGEYEDDAVAGWENYTDYISNVFYHTDDIQKLRVLSESLRSKFAPDEIREQISWAKGMRDAAPVKKVEELKRLGRISQGTQLTQEQADFEWQKYTDSLFEDIKNLTRYGDFVSVLDDYTNKLAMKQTKLDRSVESLVGRKKLNLGNQLTKIFGESTIVGNLSSALNQTAQLPMLRAEVGGKYIRQALKDIADGTLTAEEFEKQSAFLVGKMDLKSAESSRAWRDKTAAQKKATVMDVGAIPFEAVDDLASKLIVRSKYLEALANGKSTQEAIKIADEYADRLVGSREQGMKPMIFENKNSFAKLFTTFQLEVANNWAHITQDIPSEYKAIEKAQGKDAAVKLMAGRIAKYLISAFLMNRLTDEIYGGTPAPFDVGGYILGGVAAGYGKSTNTYIAGIIDNGLAQLGGDRIFGTNANGKFDAGKAIDQFGYSAGGDVPYLSNAGAMLGVTDTTLPIPQVWNKKLSAGTKALLKADDADGRRAAIETIGEGAGKAASTWVPMGNQIRKTVTGGKMLFKGGEYSGKSLEYPTKGGVKGLLTGAQALVFGPNATQAAQNYYAAGAKKLTDKATTAYKAAVNSGADRQAAYDAIQSVRSAKKTDSMTETQAKLKALQAAEINDAAKRNIYEGIISDTHAADINAITGSTGGRELTFDDYLNIQYQYTEINKKDLKGSAKATEFSSWINQQGYSDKQKEAIKNAFKYYNSSAAEATSYDKMISAGIGDAAAKRAADAALKLPAEATDYDRYRAVTSALSSNEDKLKALSSLMTTSDGDDSAYMKLKTSYDYGVNPDVYLTVKEQISGLDHLNQTSVKTMLNGILGLTNPQRAALWQLANKSWKGYNNPYDTAIGNQIYQMYN